MITLTWSLLRYRILHFPFDRHWYWKKGKPEQKGLQSKNVQSKRRWKLRLGKGFSLGGQMAGLIWHHIKNMMRKPLNYDIKFIKWRQWKIRIGEVKITNININQKRLDNAVGLLFNLIFIHLYLIFSCMWLFKKPRCFTQPSMQLSREKIWIPPFTQQLTKVKFN